MNENFLRFQLARKSIKLLKSTMMRNGFLAITGAKVHKKNETDKKKLPFFKEKGSFVKKLVVHLGFTLALQYRKGIEGKGFHLVFTGEGIDGGKEADATA